MKTKNQFLLLMRGVPLTIRYSDDFTGYAVFQSREDAKRFSNFIGGSFLAPANCAMHDLSDSIDDSIARQDVNGLVCIDGWDELGEPILKKTNEFVIDKFLKT